MKYSNTQRNTFWGKINLLISLVFQFHFAISRASTKAINNRASSQFYSWPSQWQCFVILKAIQCNMRCGKNGRKASPFNAMWGFSLKFDGAEKKNDVLSSNCTQWNHLLLWMEPSWSILGFHGQWIPALQLWPVLALQRNVWLLQLLWSAVVQPSPSRTTRSLSPLTKMMFKIYIFYSCNTPPLRHCAFLAATAFLLGVTKLLHRLFLAPGVRRCHIWGRVKE